jgi:hypothetical protein
MTVYIDDCMIPFGRMLMSHLMGTNLEELHALADRIGLRRSWFQNKRIPHYDVSKGKRLEAIRAGAIPIECSELPSDVIRQRL